VSCGNNPVTNSNVFRRCGRECSIYSVLPLRNFKNCFLGLHWHEFVVSWAANFIQVQWILWFLNFFSFKCHCNWIFSEVTSLWHIVTLSSILWVSHNSIYQHSSLLVCWLINIYYLLLEFPSRNDSVFAVEDPYPQFPSS